MKFAQSRIAQAASLSGPGLEPFAFELYRRFRDGESAEELSQRLGIPLDRIQTRLEAAARCLRRRERGSH